MKIKANFGFCIIFLALTCPLNTRADEFTNLCRLFKSGTQVKKPNSCNEYVACTGASGVYMACDGVFDQTKQVCSASASCDLKSEPCKGLNGKWLAEPSGCSGYIYCNNGQSLYGACDMGMHFDESKQMCVYEDNSSCIGVPNICKYLPDKATFRNEKDCNSYYECKSGKHSLKKCSSSTYFNVDTGKCVDKTLVACDAHPSKGICKTTLKILKGFQPDKATCRGYFYCRDFGKVEDMEPIWGQCPDGTFFDQKTLSCTEPLQAVCKYNRCEGRGTMLVTSSTDDCHSYTICQDGFPVETRQCQNDMFFDERIQACTTKVIYDKCCDGQT